MASQIHFKLKRDKDFDSITFSGMSMRLKDLKMAIAEKKFGNARGDFDLSIQQAQTQKPFSNDNAPIKKNTQVIVIMKPAINGQGLGQNKNKTMHQIQNNTSTAYHRQNSSNISYDSRFGLKGKQTGSFNGEGGDDRRALKGVPMKFQKFNEDGVASMVANDEKFQHNRDKANDVSTLSNSELRNAYGENLPKEYRCPLCENAMTEAVVLQWAHCNTCDSCIRNTMREKEGKCPFTRVKVRNWQDQVIPNNSLRKAITDFEREFAAGHFERELKARADEVALHGTNVDQTPDIILEPRQSGVDAELDLNGLVSDDGGFLGGMGGLYADFQNNDDDNVDATVIDDDDECVDFSTIEPLTSTPSSTQSITAIDEKNNQNDFNARNSISNETSSVSASGGSAGFVPGPRPPSGPPPPHVIEQRERDRIARQKQEENSYYLQQRGGNVGYGGNRQADFKNHGGKSFKRQKVKGEICRDFTKGRCNRGDGCIYQHNVSDSVPTQMQPNAYSVGGVDNMKSLEPYYMNNDSQKMQQWGMGSRDDHYSGGQQSNNSASASTYYQNQNNGSNWNGPLVSERQQSYQQSRDYGYGERSGQGSRGESNPSGQSQSEAIYYSDMDKGQHQYPQQSQSRSHNSSSGRQDGGAGDAYHRQYNSKDQEEWAGGGSEGWRRQEDQKYNENENNNKRR